jgi:hypothetical protein
MVNNHSVAQTDNKTEDTTEIRWSLPTRVLEGLRAAHLVHGDGKNLAEYAADLLFKATPSAFRKAGK